MQKPQNDESLPPSRPPIRTLTPNAIRALSISSCNPNGDDTSTVATEDIPAPPPLRGREQQQPPARIPASPAALLLPAANSTTITITTAAAPASIPSPLRKPVAVVPSAPGSSPHSSDPIPVGSTASQRPVVVHGNPSKGSMSDSSNSSNSENSNNSMGDNNSMSDNQYEVKAFMAALGTQQQDNGLNNSTVALSPGAIPVPGLASLLRLNNDDHSHWDNVLQEEEAPSEHHPRNDPPPTILVAQLAPDEAAVEARLAERLERQITEQWQERLKQEVQAQVSLLQHQHQQQQQQQQQQTSLITATNSTTILDAVVTSCSSTTSTTTPSGGETKSSMGATTTAMQTTELQKNTKPTKKKKPTVQTSSSNNRRRTPDNFQICGLRRRTWGFLLLILLVFAAGAAVGVVFLGNRPSRSGDPSSSVAPNPSPPSSSSTPTLRPTLRPTAPAIRSPAPTITGNANMKWLRQELEPWISIATANTSTTTTTTVVDPLDDPSSPQFLALDWLSKDPIATTTRSGTIFRPTVVALERYVLAVLFFSTNGPHWKTNTNTSSFPYLTEADVCEWNTGDGSSDDSLGIYCVDDFDTLGTTTTTTATTLKVETILLIQMSLDGTIPWELSLLSELALLGMDKNMLRGSIPSELNQLTHLQYLWLPSNLLTGPLPALTASASMIISIDLAGNQLNGTLPEEWGSNVRLEWLALGLNNVQGTLPSTWQGLRSLDYLDLGDNQISGTIPAAFGTQWKNASYIYMETNLITGTLPTELGELGSLVGLLVYDNFLTGTIPTEMAYLALLDMFWFSNNFLTGDVDPMFCNETERDWTILEGDCLDDSSGQAAEIQCSCCTACCPSDGSGCVDFTL